MAPKQIVDGLWQISLGAVNAFVMDAGDLTLIDTGLPGSEAKIAAALQTIGKRPADIRHILVTHCHPDHAGSLAAIKRLTGAPAYMHAVDAAMVRKGEGKRPMTPSPGLLRGLMYRMFVAGKSGEIEASPVEQEIGDGAELPIGGGVIAVHVPGHCAGQLAFLWRSKRVLLVADAAANMPNFGLALSYENLDQGLRDLAKLSALDFEIACFGHGNAIMHDAATRFNARWGAAAAV
jgi:glyoxylase-like metal-dependent hydrolase (beta-lactamase superfamily II)